MDIGNKFIIILYILYEVFLNVFLILVHKLNIHLLLMVKYIIQFDILKCN